MRLLGPVVVALIMYVAVPLLWQRAMVHQVNEISANGAGIPVGNAVEVNWAASENLMNSVNKVEINTDEAQRIAIQSSVDDAMRRSQAAQDQAWQATH